jgi:hypothetical protein
MKKSFLLKSGRNDLNSCQIYIGFNRGLPLSSLYALCWMFKEKPGVGVLCAKLLLAA